MMTFTLCWDCAKACGGCSWSKGLKPVCGWVAEQTMIKCTGCVPNMMPSYRVFTCPEFKRDAFDNGLTRMDQYRKKKRDETEVCSQ